MVMIDAEYIQKGIRGLARAYHAGPLAGHLGAAVVAGYLFAQEHPDLDREVYLGIERELDRIIGGEESIWFDPEKTGVTVSDLFEPLPEERPRDELAPTIAKALSGNISKTRQSGHNVIFAAIALRALHDYPTGATASVIDGVRKLTEGFNGQGPGRGYYGKQRGWLAGSSVSLPTADDFPPYESEQAMARAVIDELIRNASTHRRGFGGLHHIINHAAGLAELAEFGYPDLARRGFAAHRHHVRLWRSLPNVAEEFGPLERARHDPRTAEYWTTGTLRRDSAMLTHRIKTLYGFFTLLRFIEDAPTREKAEERFLYLMA